MKNKHILKHKKRGFTLVEIVVVIAIMATLTGVLAPMLVKYVEESRADKDTSHMSEITAAIELSMTQQTIYDDLIMYALESNYSCYADGSAATNIEENKVEDFNLGATPNLVEANDWWHYNDNARKLNQTVYKPSGNMSGVTITFAHNENQGKNKEICLEKGLINNMSPETKKSNATFLDNLSLDSTTYLFNHLKSIITNEVETESAKYKNSEYTVFIRMLPINADYEQYEGATVAVYGQWNGINLSKKDRRNPETETEGDSPVIPDTPTAPVTPVVPDSPTIDRTPQTPRDPATFTPPTEKTLVYNGNPQVLINAGSTSDGTMYYKLGEGEWTLTLPSGVDSGVYEVKYYVKGDSKHYDSEEYSLNVPIERADPIVTEPQSKTLTETSSAQELVIAGSAVGGTLYYRLGTGSQSTAIPTAKDPGTYTIFWCVKGDPNYKDTPEQAVVSFINGQAKALTEPTANKLEYNGKSQELLTAGETYGGRFMYKVDGGSYSMTIPSETNAGTYTVTYYIKGWNEHYFDSEEKTITVTIDKGTPKVTAPQKVSTPFNAKAQALATPGSTTGGILKYSLDNSNWSNSVPTATSAGQYKVYYKVFGDANWKDVTFDTPITSEITKAKQMTMIKAINNPYSGKAQTLIESASTLGGAEIYYRLSDTDAWSTTKPSATKPGSYTVHYYVKETADYQGVSEQTIVAVIQKVDAATANQPSVIGRTWTYDGTSKTVTVSNTTGWTMSYSRNQSSGYSSTPPELNAASTMNVYWKATHELYKDLSGTAVLQCNPANMVITATNGSATYTGAATTGGAKIDISSTAPLTSPSIKYGTSASNCNLISIPTFTNAGTYTVYYQVTDPNFNPASGSFSIHITKANNPLTLGTSQGATLVGSSATTNVIRNLCGANASVSVADSSIATVSINGIVITYTGVSKGQTHMTVSTPETNNYLAASVSYPITVSSTVVNIDLGGGTLNGSSEDLIYGVNEGAEQVQSFSYTGGCQTFTPKYSGFYYIEAWGGQGGWDAVKTGGGGGYLKAYVYLEKDQTIYVSVGGNGASSKGSAAGGWNGGAAAGGVGSSGGGGGATSITTTLRGDGQLKNYANYKDEVIMVAGGGAGGSVAIAGTGGTVLYSYTQNNSTYPGEVTNSADTSLLNGTFATGSPTGTNRDGGGGAGGWVGGLCGLDSPVTRGGGGASFVNTLRKCIPIELLGGANAHTSQNNTYAGKAKITYETKSVGLETPTREGYRFTGWVLEGGGSVTTNPLSGTTMFNFTDGEAKLVATWEPIE